MSLPCGAAESVQQALPATPVGDRNFLQANIVNGTFFSHQPSMESRKTHPRRPWPKLPKTGFNDRAFTPSRCQIRTFRGASVPKVQRPKTRVQGVAL